MDTYLGIRFTAPPEIVCEYINKLWPDREDVFWCDHPKHDDSHEGATHLHSHVVVPTLFKDAVGKPVGVLEKQAINKRIGRVLGLRGNAQSAVSIYTNGVVSAMTYMKHSPGVIFHSRTDAVKEMYDKAPAWVENRAHMQAGDGQSNDIHEVMKAEKALSLTAENILGVMRKHQRLAKLEEKGFVEVLESLIKKTRWRLGHYLKANKIPREIVEEFNAGAQACASVWVKRYMPYGI